MEAFRCVYKMLSCYDIFNRLHLSSILQTYSEFLIVFNMDSNCENTNGSLLASLLSEGKQSVKTCEGVSTSNIMCETVIPSCTPFEDKLNDMIDFNMDEFIWITDVQQSSIGPQIAESTLPHFPSSSNSPPVIHIIEDLVMKKEEKGKRLSKKRATTDSSAAVKRPKNKRECDTIKSLNISRSNTSKAKGRSRKSVKESSKNVLPSEVTSHMKCDIVIDSLSSFAPLQSHGKRKKDAKRDINEANITIAKCDEKVRELDVGMMTVHSYHEQIAQMKVDIARLWKQADTLKGRIEKDRQLIDNERKLGEEKLCESSRIYQEVIAIQDVWRRELDKAFQSDSD